MSVYSFVNVAVLLCIIHVHMSVYSFVNVAVLSCVMHVYMSIYTSHYIVNNPRSIH